MRILIYGALAFLTPECMAQWIGADVPGYTANFTQVYSPPDRDEVYYCGFNDVDLDSSGWQPAILRYEAGIWDTLHIPGTAYSVVEYHDTLFAGGSFAPHPLDSGFTSDVQYYALNSWHALGVFNDWNVRRLRVLDDTLYAVGSFTEVDGQTATGAARLINGLWVPLPLLPSPFYSLLDIIKHNGRLVISGSFFINGATGIAYLDGGQWNILGPGILGGFSSIHAMAVYQGDLYIGGQIDMGAGNAGRDIMRWDGTQFQPVGGGLQRNLGDNSGFSDVRGMEEHNGVLYVGGGFRYAGGVPAYGVAGWDGTQWCGVPGNLSDGSGHLGVGQGGMAFYQDTLFVACGYLADGDSVRLAAKFVGTSYADTCSGPVGIAGTAAEVLLSLAPNPATDQITFSGLPGTGPWSIQLFDLEGRAHAIRTEAKGEGLILYRGDLAAGCYTLVIAADDAKQRSVARVVFVDP
jgi:hypothetical protein